jgi:glyoxylase-like metal-dependent hydrolase (beta-lactamase superfamily II)
VTKITERIRAVEVSKADGLSTFVYILNCDGGLILIDVGFTPQCFANIEAELKKMKKGWDDIKLILITHAHGDHIENLPKVLEATGYPEVMLGAGDVEKLKDETGVEADMGLEHGDIIGACGNIEIINVPGHSPGCLTFYLQEEKAMIVGDTIFGDDDGNLYTPPAKYSNDAEMAAREIRRLLDHDFNMLLLSHGKSIMVGAKKRVEELVGA